MNNFSLAALGSPPPAYERLRDRLCQTSWICQGTLVCRPLLRRVGGRQIQKGPYYLWTTKVDGRTVCQSLSKAQFQAVGRAIANYRQLQKTLQRMHALSFKTILRTIPGVKQRK
jgi:hypothetical protein